MPDRLPEGRVGLHSYRPVRTFPLLLAFAGPGGASPPCELQPLRQVCGGCCHRSSLHSPMVDNTERVSGTHLPSVYLCWRCVWSVTYFAHFFESFVFLLLTSFYILDINSLSDICFANIFSPYVAFLLT